jgi:hypothetical protein
MVSAKLALLGGNSEMSQIFNSHSQRDEEIKSFFYRAFSGTSVLPKWQEYEEQPTRPVDEEIELKIQASSAVFVLLGENVERLPFTRDWVLWECGKATDKDVWVFEPYESIGKIAVTIPRFKHYVRYHRNKTSRDYINTIIKSYDNSNLLGWAGAGAGIGAALSSEDRGGGALLGSFLGAIVESVVRPKAPTGIPVTCLKCSYSYGVHIPGNRGQFRCAKCNNRMELVEQPATNYLPPNAPQWVSQMR